MSSLKKRICYDLIQYKKTIDDKHFVFLFRKNIPSNVLTDIAEKNTTSLYFVKNVNHWMRKQIRDIECDVYNTEPMTTPNDILVSIIINKTLELIDSI